MFTCGICLNGMQANYIDIVNVDNAAQEQIYQLAVTNLEPWKEKTVFIRCWALATQRHVFEAVLFCLLSFRYNYLGVRFTFNRLSANSHISFNRARTLKFEVPQGVVAILRLVSVGRGQLKTSQLRTSMIWHLPCPQELHHARGCSHTRQHRLRLRRCAPRLPGGDGGPEHVLAEDSPRGGHGRAWCANRLRWNSTWAVVKSSKGLMPEHFELSQSMSSAPCTPLQTTPL